MQLNYGDSPEIHNGDSPQILLNGDSPGLFTKLKTELHPGPQ